jgi:hypothetical protein
MAVQLVGRADLDDAASVAEGHAIRNLAGERHLAPGRCWSWRSG